MDWRRGSDDWEAEDHRLRCEEAEEARREEMGDEGEDGPYEDDRGAFGPPLPSSAKI